MGSVSSPTALNATKQNYGITKIKELSPMQVGVRATFFINSDNLHLDDPAVVAQNKQSLVRMVTEGHVVGDHSYDHMAHNTINDSPR